ncbi:MAG: hypothetical protein AB1679_34495, partial [Actinomycetota bacterium]
MALRRRWSYLALFSALAVLGSACSGGSSEDASKSKADQTEAASPAPADTSAPAEATPTTVAADPAATATTAAAAAP